MSEHYYSKKPVSKSDRKEIKVIIDDQSYYFQVDHGVFSKGGLDFGTRLLLESIEVKENVDGNIVDAGCGWGPIGIYLAKNYPKRHVYMIDINDRSVELSELNSKRNGVEEQTTVTSGNLLEPVEGNDIALIVTNPPIRAGKQTIFELYEQAYANLKTEGELWIVIQKKQGAPSTEKKLEELGFDVEIVKKSKGYFVFRAKKD